ncbi:MAG: RNA methyltransferase [Acidimicrobiales bacterium]|nr:RNA methyltransferase [Acidimicrobiales bacterium]
MDPRDRFITVPGRKPVLEALADERLRVDKVLVSHGAGGPVVEEIVAAAARRKVPVERVTEQRVSLIAGGSRHHQGVVADVVAPGMQPVEAFLDRRRRGKDWATTVLVLDRVHNPANVGMILRTAVGAGMDGVVVPHAGTADLGPVVLKASAGLAFGATILRSATTEDALDALRAHRFTIVGLAADGDPLFAADLPDRLALVLGNESEGLSPAVRERCDRTVAIPLAEGVESLNVAVAAGIVAYEVVRRRG